MEIDQQSNKQVKSWGGKREGAGRKPGAIQKLSGRDLLATIENKLGISFAEQIANNYMAAIAADDSKLKLEYDRLILSKVIADKVDVTTDGEKIVQPIINIMTKEIPEFVNVKPG